MIKSILAMLVKITEFMKEHPIWFIIIFILILRYFVPIPYLPDFVGTVAEFIKSLELISFGK